MSVSSITDGMSDLALAPFVRALMAKQHEKRLPPTRMVYMVGALRLRGRGVS